MSHVPRLMAIVACHLPRLVRSPDSALALIVAAPSLKSSWNRSLLILSRIRRRLILLPLSTNTHILDASCVIYFYFNGQSCPDHRVPSSHVCQRMMKPLEVTRPSLAHRCTSPCSDSSHSARLHNDGNYSAYSLYKGLWFKHRWWLTIIPSMTSTSSSSICHLHKSNSLLDFFSCLTSGVCAITNRPQHPELSRSFCPSNS